MSYTRLFAAIAELNFVDCLSLSRIAVLPAFIWAVIHDRFMLAVALFAWAVTSDLIDGPLARYQQLSSPRGGLIDHTADAVFVAGTCALWAWMCILPGLLPLLIVAAFSQYVIDPSPLPGPRASRLGRINGIVYFILSGSALAVHICQPGDTWRHALLMLAWLVVLSTAISMASRFAYARNYARDN